MLNKASSIVLLIALTSLVSCKRDQCVCAQDNVCVNITNSSGRVAHTVAILAQGVNPNAIGPLSPNDKACFSFRSPGENAFRVMAILSTGDTIKSAEVYSEGGYEFIGAIQEGEINIRQNTD